MISKIFNIFKFFKRKKDFNTEHEETPKFQDFVNQIFCKNCSHIITDPKEVKENMKGCYVHEYIDNGIPKYRMFKLTCKFCTKV